MEISWPWAVRSRERRCERELWAVQRKRIFIGVAVVGAMVVVDVVGASGEDDGCEYLGIG